MFPAILSMRTGLSAITSHEYITGTVCLRHERITDRTIVKCDRFGINQGAAESAGEIFFLFELLFF
jgi:hypothetical protein